MLKSFLSHSSNSHFSLHNIPFSAGKRVNSNKTFCVSRIGDYIIDLNALEHEGFFADFYKGKLFNSNTLNKFMAKDKTIWLNVRKRIQDLFLASNTSLSEDGKKLERILIKEKDFINTLPVSIGDYTDFYSGYHHAFNCGVMFRGVINALSPNWLHMPIAYHGRSSSVQINTDVVRPNGQIFDKEQDKPVFGPCKKLDYEVEIGYFIGGKGSKIGKPVKASEALDHVFGVVLLNDWSARDIQLWEMQPLGPFTSKNFLTTISPWIVMLEALKPFQVPIEKPLKEQLSYLQGDFSTYDIELSTYLQTLNSPIEVISKTSLKYIYWAISQQIAHHTITGCNIKPGDLMGTGTISGPNQGTGGCLMELAKDAREPISLSTGETRSYLQDHDIVTFEGVCHKDDITVGFGTCSSKVIPSIV
ncbi:hypothetical protein SteCoe_39416 [Stentor coeruleus]|uniref:Fumarylacetoacetase n=1 Tax=Stentor coeruleus TaxID=5963 RepID=A0A1R2AKX5_9CILI|nr:hypothetical protein SteCoe_39416 [Stentor coeruleus]